MFRIIFTMLAILFFLRFVTPKTITRKLFALSAGVEFEFSGNAGMQFRFGYEMQTAKVYYTNVLGQVVGSEDINLGALTFSVGFFF